MIGKNHVLVIGTKIDLLPRRTDLGQLAKWLRATLSRYKVRALDIKLVSSWTQRGINEAVGRMLDLRRGVDVFVVGAANAGKSMFIHRLLDQLEQRFPNGKVEEVERPMVSDTPGTTLGIMPLRAFRKNATSRLFASLYDTPGIHQPQSMQNLLPIEEYEAVQPTREFSVRNRRPAKDVVYALRNSGEPLTAEAVEAGLRAPVRYLWGPRGAAPVAVVEVVPPVSSMLHLSFIAVEDLEIRCESAHSLGLEGAEEIQPPEGLSLARVCYIDVPEEISQEGDVLCDVALAGFGWFAVTASAAAGTASGRQSESSKFTLRVYGPPRLKVKFGMFPMPIAGLPGLIPALPDQDDDGYDISLDDDDDKGHVPKTDPPPEDDDEPEEMRGLLDLRVDADGSLRTLPQEDVDADDDYDRDEMFSQRLRQSAFDRGLDDATLPDDDFEDYDPFGGSYSAGLVDDWAEPPMSGSQQRGKTRGAGWADGLQAGGLSERERKYGTDASDSRRSARPQHSKRESRNVEDASQNSSARPGRKPSVTPQKSEGSPAASPSAIGRGAGGTGGLVRRIKR